MRIIRALFFIVYALFFNLFIGLPLLIICFLLQREEPLYRVYRSFLKISFLIFSVSVETKGLENIPPPPVILAPNHASYLDGPALLAGFPCKMRAMIKKSVFRIPILGQVLLFGKFIKVERGNVKRASEALKRAEKLLKDGENLLIFPEGTRTRDGRLGRFREGVCRLSMNTGVSIVPVIVEGSYKLMSRKDFIPKSGRVLIFFLPPVYPSEFESSKDMCDVLRTEIESELRI